jgi:predicted MFS family arabinose efflux permease
MSKKPKAVFTGYEWFIVAVITFIQFTVILDFMVLSPLSAILIPEMHITPSQFGLVVSVYAFSAGASGLLAAGFADNFDRKRLLMFFYTGFVIGTALCAMASTYEFLLMARIFTGIFGGVIGSISFAIITDLFKLEVRGRVMGFVQMAFAVSQILGLPIGLFLATRFDWHAPFWMIVGVSVPAGVVILLGMRPVTDHLKFKKKNEEKGLFAPFRHLFETITKPDYLKGFAASALLATGGYMLMPLGAAFGTNNLGLSKDDLIPLYAITGVFTIFFGPLAGKLADVYGKYRVFIVGCVIAMIMIGWYTHLGITPLWMVIAINVVLFAGLTARMVAASALITAVPAPQDRGVFMGINSSIQQISGGIAAVIAGLIVVQQGNTGHERVEVAGVVAKESVGKLENYGILGFVVMGSLVATIILFWGVDRMVTRKIAAAPVINSEKAPVAIAE